jgi:hypothetical protein
MRWWVSPIFVALAGLLHLECQQITQSSKVSQFNKRWSASVTRDENGGFAVDRKYQRRY